MSASCYLICTVHTEMYSNFRLYSCCRLEKMRLQSLLIAVLGLTSGFLVLVMMLENSVYERNRNAFQRQIKVIQEDRLSLGGSQQAPAVTSHKRLALHGRDKKKRVRVLCWIMTMFKNLKSQARYVKLTWGKRCDILLFFGSAEDKEFPLIKLPVPEGRDHLTEKTYGAFRYVHKHFLDKADWFLKADDDTFVLMDNLKNYLSDKNTDDPVYMGFKFTGKTAQGYNSGGAGYVLSKEALRRFAAKGKNLKICPFNGGVEDADIGRCMSHLGVKMVNTLDNKNRTRFHSYDPVTHLHASDKYLASRSGYGYKTGARNISDYPISFHYVKGKDMEKMELLLYHVKHVGRGGTVLN